MLEGKEREFLLEIKTEKADLTDVCRTARVRLDKLRKQSDDVSHLRDFNMTEVSNWLVKLRKSL